METFLTQPIVISQLWSAYKKTKEYQQGLIHAIPSGHRLVIAQEVRGLKSIYIKFVNNLKSHKDTRNELNNRDIADWLVEWQEMHKLLFQHIFKDCGRWRTIQVRFGDIGDEDLYRIPLPHQVHKEIGMLGEQLTFDLKSIDFTDDEKYRLLAIVHYQFVRVHPFADGNGRIARAVTDQLALYFGFPVAMGGFPRHDEKSRLAYHHAIKSCINDPDCMELAAWIRSYIEKQIEQIA